MKLHGLMAGALMICLAGTASLGQVACTTTTSSSSGSSGGGSGGGVACAADTSLTCDPGSDGFSCTSGDNPETTDSSLFCSDPSPQPDGTDGFCCATISIPTTCQQDDSVQGCPYPALGFSCTGSDTPDQADSSLSCSSATIDPNTGDSLYCCQ